MTTHKDEGFAVATDSYRTLQEALHCFLLDMNIHSKKIKAVTRLDRYFD